MTARELASSLWAIALLIAACSEVCDPGESQLCACPDGEMGGQACASDGSRWKPCNCASTDTDTDADTDTDIDTDTDTDSDECNDSCAAGFHDGCSCMPSDPCGWADNGLCDGMCIEWFEVDEMFDDTADCTGPCTGMCNSIGDFVRVYTECACQPDDPCGWADDGICDAPCVGGEYPPNTDGPWSGIDVGEMFDDSVDCDVCQPDDVADCDAAYAACQLACGDDGGSDCYDACFTAYCECVTSIGCDPADYDCT